MSFVEGYQEERELEAVEPENQNFATVGEVYEDGVSLIFDGTSEPTQKHYKVNSGVIFKAGDRVRIAYAILSLCKSRLNRHCQV